MQVLTRLLATLALAVLVGCGGETDKGGAKRDVRRAPAAAKPAPVEKRPDDADPKPRVALETTHGTIVLELDRVRAPLTVSGVPDEAASLTAAATWPAVSGK